jgi:hypothetical protein
MVTLFGLYPFLLTIHSDGGYPGPDFRSAVKVAITDLSVEIVTRSRNGFRDAVGALGG